MDGRGNDDGPPQPKVQGQKLPYQQQMEAAIQILEQRIQQLGIEA